MRKNIIFVTHNPITRLQLKIISSENEFDQIIHIDTRANPCELKIKGNFQLSRCQFPCNTYYTDDELKKLNDTLKKLIDEKQEYTLVVPHLYNHLFAVLVELRCVKELIYVEEGNLSLGLVKKIDMKLYSYKDLVKKKETSEELKQINIFDSKIYEKDANERISLMPLLKNQPMPRHPKFTSSISVSRRAFPNIKENRQLKKNQTSVKI